MSRLAQTASEHNMLFIPVTSPDASASTLTINWWTRAHTNGRWFRDVVAQILQNYPIDIDRIWCAGYSGGADFISYELLGHGVSHLLGATMIGGGGVDGVHVDQVPAVHAHLFWHVGDRDDGVFGFGWSARKAAEEGYRLYSTKGASTSLEILPGVQHTSYDIDSLIRSDLESVQR